MSKCPHCNQEMHLEEHVRRNVETYGKPVLVALSCCGRAVTVGRIVSFSISAYNGERTEDDWGDEIKTGKVLQSAINDALGEKGLAFIENGEYMKAYGLIRQQTNPLTAAWLATFLCENVSEGQKQFKNWLANASYNGV